MGIDDTVEVAYDVATNFVTAWNEMMVTMTF